MRRRHFVVLKNDGFHVDFLSFGDTRDQAASDWNSVHGDFHVRPGFMSGISHFDVVKGSGKSPVQSVFVPFGGDARGDPEAADLRADPRRYSGTARQIQEAPPVRWESAAFPQEALAGPQRKFRLLQFERRCLRGYERMSSIQLFQLTLLKKSDSMLL